MQQTQVGQGNRQAERERQGKYMCIYIQREREKHAHVFNRHMHIDIDRHPCRQIERHIAPSLHISNSTQHVDYSSWADQHAGHLRSSGNRSRCWMHCTGYLCSQHVQFITGPCYAAVVCHHVRQCVHARACVCVCVCVWGWCSVLPAHTLQACVYCSCQVGHHQHSHSVGGAHTCK